MVANLGRLFNSANSPNESPEIRIFTCVNEGSTVIVFFLAINFLTRMSVLEDSTFG
jgi:hypothetical protein